MELGNRQVIEKKNVKLRKVFVSSVESGINLECR